ncbi:MAG: Fur family transcriptional regulator [Candidatus Binatia bacterium]
MKQRATRQLGAVYEVLAASQDHPTAEQVFQRVRRVVPQVSLGTVYRNLDKLRDQGRLRVVRLERDVAHYDARTDDHDHFVCEGCAAVLDLARAQRRPRLAGPETIGCVVRWHTTAVYGLCQSCATRPAAGHAPDEAR